MAFSAFDKLFIAAALWMALLSNASSSALSEAAARLEPGESIRLDTPLTGAILNIDKSNFLQWGSSAAWDPVRQEVRFIGKRDGRSPYRFLVYDIASNSWSNDRKVDWNREVEWGHGYDHNAVDPRTGTHYFRGFNSGTIHKWDGEWSTIPSMPRFGTRAGSITWFPGLGLVYTDQTVVQYFDGSSWRRIDAKRIERGLHAAAEYNPVADVLIYGGGNDAPYMRKLDASRRVTEIAAPPFNIGASSSQAVLVSDPSAAKFIAWRKNSTDWIEYDVETDQWNDIAQSTGDGSSPQLGAPNLSPSRRSGAVIAAPIDSLRVVMFIQYLGDDDTRAGVWLYRHGEKALRPRPSAPEL